MKAIFVLLFCLLSVSIVYSTLNIPDNIRELSTEQVENITGFNRFETRGTQIYAVFEDTVEEDIVEVDVLYSCVEDFIGDYRDFGCFNNQKERVRFSLRHELPACESIWVEESEFVEDPVCETCSNPIVLGDWMPELDLGNGQYLESREVLTFIGSACEERQTKEIRLAEGQFVPELNLPLEQVVQIILVILIFGTLIMRGKK